MEAKVHHFAAELVKVMRLPEKVEGTAADNITRHFMQTQAQSSSRRLSQSLFDKVAESSSNASALFKKYEDLRARKIPETDSLMQLLCEIAGDNDVKAALKKQYSDSQKAAADVSGESKEIKLAKQLHDLFQQRLEKESKARTVPQGMVEFPRWIKERPHMSWDFTCLPHLDTNQSGLIGGLPHNAQEKLLLEDILHCLSGIDGDHIIALPRKSQHSHREFKYDESADSSILEMTKRIMPLCSYYSTIVSFIEEKMQFKYGKVNHAVTAPMREMLKDYFILVSQLESEFQFNKLSLQKLWFYIQKTMVKMEALASAATALNEEDCFGGAVLSVLHKRATCLIGNREAQEIYLHLTQCASVPYFEILQKWIHEGVIWDPYSEFLVEDNEICKIEDVSVEYSNNYWEKRYTVKRENIPVFLEKATDMILRTGKYLNVIRQCGHNIKYPNSTPLTYSLGEQSYFDRIQDAYHFASKKLLDLLMEENDLRGRLRSVKHYFLLDEGDFITQFMDMAEEELHKDIDNIMPSRLEALLELALRTSSVNCDKYKDCVKVVLIMESLQAQMSAILNILNISAVKSTEGKQQNEDTDEPILGMEAVTFDYEVHWPLSLIINQRAIACYQFLFRHLFHCKYVESRLGRVWTLNKITKKYPLMAYRSYAPAFALCQRMMNFIQNLDYYFTLEVMEPNWQLFMGKINQVSNVDEVLQCHEDFLNTCIIDCMLAYPSLLEILGKLMTLCISFSNFMLQTHRNAVEAELQSLGNNLMLSCESTIFGPSGEAESMSVQLTFKQKVMQYQAEFDELFVSFLEAITNMCNKELSHHGSKMLNMLYRLNFSGFYSRRLSEKQVVPTL